MARLPDRLVALLLRGYFTKTNMLLHAMLYPVLMILEGGDFHLFLDAISIEAVFVGLMVGISTKRIIAHNHGLIDLVQKLVHHHESKEPPSGRS